MAAQPAKMSVREYAKLVGVAPQNVYYYIRKGDIEEGPCECCGRKVITVTSADKIFRKEAP